jgi:signal transduction histidine kinase
MIRKLRAFAGNRSILMQIGAVFLLCQIVAQIAVMAFIVWRFERPEALRGLPAPFTETLAIDRMLMAASPDERAVVARLALATRPDLALVETASLRLLDASVTAGDPTLGLLASVAPAAAARARLAAREEGAGPPRIALTLPDGQALVFDPHRWTADDRLPGALAWMKAASVLIPLAILALWAVLMLTAPLTRLAGAAERFAVDLDPTPMPERGPAELRKLAHAFNVMRGRIRRLVESRSRMLAAVSHDLRTPLTRIRLRIEAQEPSEDRARMLREIEAMDRMIGQALAHLRDQASAERRERVDLPTLLESLCDDFADAGAPVSYHGRRRVVLDGDPGLLTRAFANLVDNAVKFGGGARVTLALGEAGEAVVHILDEGPGIPADRKALAFEPFSRGDDARGAVGPEGFGLGLAIARQIIERHGGQIALRDREPQGLDVEVALPIAASPTESRLAPADAVA